MQVWPLVCLMLDLLKALFCGPPEKYQFCLSGAGWVPFLHMTSPSTEA